MSTLPTLETLLFIPHSSTQVKEPKPKNTNMARPKKPASPLTACVLWVITIIFFAGFLTEASWAGVSLFISISFAIVAGIVTSEYKAKQRSLNPPKPNWICANCGTLLTWEKKTPPGADDVCVECRTNLVVPLATPRGQELFATYHGKVTAKQRVEIGDEATQKLLRTLEPIPASGSIALELEKLAGLVRTGAITHEEWQRAKALYLGQPEDARQNTLARVQQLYDLCQSGALSESEFNMVKWDVLAKGMAKGIG